MEMETMSNDAGEKQVEENRRDGESVVIVTPVMPLSSGDGMGGASSGGGGSLGVGRIVTVTGAKGDGEPICATPDHKVMVEGVGFAPISDLAQGSDGAVEGNRDTSKAMTTAERQMEEMSRAYDQFDRLRDSVERVGHEMIELRHALGEDAKGDTWVQTSALTVRVPMTAKEVMDAKQRELDMVTRMMESAFQRILQMQAGVVRDTVIAMPRPVSVEEEVRRMVESGATTSEDGLVGYAHPADLDSEFIGQHTVSATSQDRTLHPAATSPSDTLTSRIRRGLRMDRKGDE